MSAESANGSTPGVRVTWSTTAPPECVESVRVDFRHGEHGSVATSYTTTNTSDTQVIQSPLQCATEYYVRVFVIAVLQRLGHVQKQSIQKRVVVGGNENIFHLAQQSFWSYFFCIHNVGGQVHMTI